MVNQFTSFFGFDPDAVAVHSHSLVVVGSNLQHIVLPCDQPLHQVVVLSLVGDVADVPRTLVVPVESVADHIAQDLTIAVFLYGGLPLRDDL